VPFRDETKWVHRVWLDDEPQPDDFKLIGCMWQDLNPSWRVVDWDSRALHTIDMLTVPRSFDLTPRQVRDIVGLALVHQYGGIYACWDMEPTQALNEHQEFNAWMAHSGYIGSRVIQDPVWSMLLDLLRHMGREVTPDTDLTDFYRQYAGADLTIFREAPRARRFSSDVSEPTSL
jgi:hypothetical protein